MVDLPIWARLPSTRFSRDLAIGFCIGLTVSLSSTSWYLYRRNLRARSKAYDEDNDEFPTQPIQIREDEILDGITDLIGNTPLLRINSLSDALGVNILGKAEFLNPGGSVKDRVALKIINDAEQRGFIKPHTGSCIFEGTSGSTGISIATIARARGYSCTIIMPSDISEDKVKALTALGANVERVKPASIVDKQQFVNIARGRALDFGKDHRNNGDSSIIDDSFVVSMNSSYTTSTPMTEEQAEYSPRGFFADQFENESNYYAHFEGTGPEIWRQTNGNVDGFVSGAGTGGTIAGVGNFLKLRDPSITITLADPEGSGLYFKVKYGVLWDPVDREGTKRRHQVDSVVEGIGLNRLTQNLERGLRSIDESFRVTDAEAASMSRFIAEKDGLFLGSSSACNLVACVRLAQSKGWRQGERIVTVLCDSGSRHYSKFWNDAYLLQAGVSIDRHFVQRLLSAEIN